MLQSLNKKCKIHTKVNESFMAVRSVCARRARDQCVRVLIYFQEIPDTKLAKHVNLNIFWIKYDSGLEILNESYQESCHARVKNLDVLTANVNTCIK